MSAVPDPLTGVEMMRVPNPEADVSAPGALRRAVETLRAVPKSGVHNPLKNPERYLLYGRVCGQVAERLRDPEVESFFASLIQRVSPKSRAQAVGEVVITRQFFENFGGDQVRFLARSFGVPGDHYGQVRRASVRNTALANASDYAWLPRFFSRDTRPFLLIGDQRTMRPRRPRRVVSYCTVPYVFDVT